MDLFVAPLQGLFIGAVATPRVAGVDQREPPVERGDQSNRSAGIGSRDSGTGVSMLRCPVIAMIPWFYEKQSGMTILIRSDASLKCRRESDSASFIFWGLPLVDPSHPAVRPLPMPSCHRFSADSGTLSGTRAQLSRMSFDGSHATR